MGEESLDELMGPSPRSRSEDPPTGGDPKAHVRHSSARAPPPAAMFTRTSSTGSSSGPPANAFNSSGAAISLPKRWSQYEAYAEKESAGATANAVYMASNAAASREGSSGSGSVASRSNAGSAFEDEDMMEDPPSKSNLETGNVGNGEMGKNYDEDDEDIGRAYDVDHDNIRQEALRMLEVADANKHYSLHRTITGGFTSEHKSLGSKKPRALSGLNFVANRKNEGKRYSDYATTQQAPVDYYESLNESVVDVDGLEKRFGSESEAAETDQSGNNRNWSSRYSIDNTLLAMSGGTVSQSKLDRDRTERQQQRERLSALNMFGASPSKTEVFGSGFSFRQKHVFGKQNVNANLQYDAGAGDCLPPANPRLKTWQEQLLKRQRQRRWLLAICLGLICTIVPLATILSLRSKRTVSALNVQTLLPTDGVTFFVTGDSPFNGNDEPRLKKDLAVSASTTSFAVHLGNIQNASVTLCPEYHYRAVADILEECSPKPVFVVPGEEDWNNCPDPDAAWDHWWKNFNFFDKRWDNVKSVKPFHVTRQSSQEENWAFVHDGVLFIGVHVVNGKVVDQAEFDERNNNNFRWVVAESNSHHSEIRAVVVFGNAIRGKAENKTFFAQLEEFWRNWDKPALYVHASDGTGRTNYYKPFDDLDHVTAVQVESGGDLPPLRINVGFDENPFVFGQTEY